jgi:succinate dehydrogenase / fumarate reductase membrane anchor subunit
MQRVSSLALIPLSVWFLIALLRLPDLHFATVHGWLAAPLPAFLAALLVVTLTYHSWLGVTVVTEDYVHGTAAKMMTLLSLRYAHVLAGAAALFAILRIALGAPGA